MAFPRTLFVAAGALALAGCGSRDDAGAGEAAPAAEPASQAAASTLCLFEEADTREWAGVPNAGQGIDVTGQIRVADPNYTARLDRPEIRGEVTRLWLSMAENPDGEAPPDGWREVSFTIEDDGSVRRVEIWCDLETRLAEFPVRR